MKFNLPDLKTIHLALVLAQEMEESCIEAWGHVKDDYGLQEAAMSKQNIKKFKALIKKVKRSIKKMEVK